MQDEELDIQWVPGGIKDRTQKNASFCKEKTWD